MKNDHHWLAQGAAPRLEDGPVEWVKPTDQAAAPERVPDPEDVGPRVRTWLIWIVIAFAVPAALLLKALAKREPAALIFMAIIAVVAITLFWVLSESSFSRRKIRDPRITLREWQTKQEAERRDRDIT